MRSVVLIPWAKNDWTETGRHVAKVTLPLTNDGRRQAEQWGQVLHERGLRYVYASDEQTSQDTAEAIAEAANAKVKAIRGIEEVDFGLWAGLTEETLKQRFPRAYKRWKADPTSVCPPEGEALETAAQRIGKSIEKAIRKAADAPIGIVLGPVACAVARCALEGIGIEQMRQRMTAEPVWYDEAAMPSKLATAEDAVQDRACEPAGGEAEQTRERGSAES